MYWGVGGLCLYVGSVLTAVSGFVLPLGTGDHAVFNQGQFKRRIDVVKTQEHNGVAVLHGLQYSAAKLAYPPSKCCSDSYRR